VTSSKTERPTLATALTLGVPSRVIVKFCVDPALLAAVIVTVPVCPGVIVLGENVAVVPAGRPTTDMVTVYVGGLSTPVRNE